MLKKIIIKVSSSLTVRIFLITALILAVSCGATYAFLAWATPISYVSVVSDELDDRALALAKELQQSTLEDCGPILDRFISQTGAGISITDEDGVLAKLPESVDTKAADTVVIDTVTNSGTAVSSYVAAESEAVSDSASNSDEGNRFQDNSVYNQEELSQIETSVITVKSTSSTSFPFSFRDDGTLYYLEVDSAVETVNQATEAIVRVFPWLVLVVLVISLIGAVIYSWYITKPIVQISRISQKMADLDFSWSCPGSRTDEIGRLGRNLNTLSARLSDSLSKLQDANQTLQRDIDRERELEQQRIAFFSAASHELKTPITILKGQLSGMLAGIDIYKDRDKYLAKSLAAANRMEGLVQEILAVSRMERSDFILRQVPVDLSAMVNGLVEFLRDLTDQRNQILTTYIEPAQVIKGDPSLLERAAANLLSNASLHSPDGARIEVRLASGQIETDGPAASGTGPVLTIFNSGVSIPEENLPHLFDAFYRVDASRSRATGGSGLGLYLVKIILDRHEAVCRIENKNGGVLVTVVTLSPSQTRISPPSSSPSPSFPALPRRFRDGTPGPPPSF